MLEQQKNKIKIKTQLGMILKQCCNCRFKSQKHLKCLRNYKMKTLLKQGNKLKKAVKRGLRLKELV